MSKSKENLEKRRLEKKNKEKPATISKKELANLQSKGAKVIPKTNSETIQKRINSLSDSLNSLSKKIDKIGKAEKNKDNDNILIAFKSINISLNAIAKSINEILKEKTAKKPEKEKKPVSYTHKIIRDSLNDDIVEIKSTPVH
jgi:hypothetical protein